MSGADLSACSSFTREVMVRGNHNYNLIMDCGLFAIAVVTALAFNIDPSVLKLKQEVTTAFSYLLT